MPKRSQYLLISKAHWNHICFDGMLQMPAIWNDGTLEHWNDVPK
jgi:hypothetical protein